MAEFCKECPMKGSIDGAASSLLVGPYKFEANRWSYRANESGYVGSLTDGYGGVSELMYLPSDRLADTAIEARIDNCQKPTEYIEKRGILRKTYRALGCSAVGNLAVTDPALRVPTMANMRRAALAYAQPRPSCTE